MLARLSTPRRQAEKVCLSLQFIAAPLHPPVGGGGLGGVGRGGVNGGQGTWGRKGRKDGGDRVAGAFSSWRILLRSAAAESGTVRVRYCAIWSDRNLLPRSQILFIALKAPTIATGPRPSPSSTRKKGSERSRAMSVPGGWCRQKWSVVGGRRYIEMRCLRPAAVALLAWNLGPPACRRRLLLIQCPSSLAGAGLPQSPRPTQTPPPPLARALMSSLS